MENAGTGQEGRRPAALLLRKFFAFAMIALVLAVALARREELAGVLARVDLFWLSLGMGFFAASYVLRAARLKLLTGGALRVWPDSLAASITHGTLAYLMPMQTGDLALPALLKASCGMSLGDGLKVLVRFRALDLCALGLWILGAALLLPAGMDDHIRYPWILCGIIFTASPVIIHTLSHIRHLRPRWLFRHAEHLAAAKGVDAPTLLSSVLIWGMTGGVIYCASRAVGLALAAGDAWFLLTVQLPFQLLPVQGFANAGTHEAAWVGALTMLGYGAGEALDFALSTHFLVLVYVLALFLAGAVIAGVRGAGGKGPSARGQA